MCLKKKQSPPSTNAPEGGKKSPPLAQCAREKKQSPLAQARRGGEKSPPQHKCAKEKKQSFSQARCTCGEAQCTSLSLVWLGLTNLVVSSAFAKPPCLRLKTHYDRKPKSDMLSQGQCAAKTPKDPKIIRERTAWTCASTSLNARSNTARLFNQ